MKRKGTAKRSNSQRRAVNRFRLFVVLGVLDVLLIVGTLLMLPMALQSVDEATGKPNAWFGVESITVKGNTRYDDETIIAVSGIVEGKSVFSISERNAEQYIRDTFSYIKDVSVDVAMGGDVTITVTEHKELGTVYANGSWMVVSDEGIGLMQMPVESERPYRRLYLKGAEILSPKVGAKVIGGKDLEIAKLPMGCTTWGLSTCQTAATYGSTGKIRLKLRWEMTPICTTRWRWRLALCRRF